MTFLTLKSQSEEIKQVQELDSEMLLSFVCLIMITCKVLLHLWPLPSKCLLLIHDYMAKR